MNRRELLHLLAVPAFAGKGGDKDLRLRGAVRKPEQKQWIQVHLEGSPYDIGYQHGFLLAAEIADTHRAIALGLTHDSKPYEFFRQQAQKIFWPHTDAEFQSEIQGMAEGLKAKGVKLDVCDLTVMNASLEFSYLLGHLEPHQKQPVAERCSAFVATGSYTKDGRIVIAHNCWTDYLTGARWNIIFDIVPEKGHRFLMDGLPGLIHSGDDFGVNAAGLLITETTITGFRGFDPHGIPEFCRARRAMQYASSIDEFASIMKEGNNGGYANNWLVADRKTNEIASLELGLKNVILQKKKDGYFAGANKPEDPKLAREETDFNVNDPALSPNARMVRWHQLMAEHKGKIDLALAQKFMADHHDTVTQRDDANERTLCGHIEASPRGVPGWAPPYGLFGAAQNKAADAALAEQMSFTACFGHACGTHVKADEHLKRHPEFAWQRGVLRDLRSGGWAAFRAS
jgi:hypothetical protein